MLTSTDVFDPVTRQRLIAAGVLRAPASLAAIPPPPVKRNRPGPKPEKDAALCRAEESYRSLGAPKRGYLSRIAREFKVNPGSLHSRIYGPKK